MSGGSLASSPGHPASDDARSDDGRRVDGNRMHRPLPNFFLVGAFKAGTTAFYQYLRQHPDVYLSPRKEPAYFVHESRTERLNPVWRRRHEADAAALARYLKHPHWGPAQPSGPVTEWDDYLRLFEGARPGQAIGEGSVGCLWSRTAARAISERIPDARIMMILRNPCDRAFSQFIGALNETLNESFSEAIRRSASSPPPPLFDALNPLLDFGLYSEQVARLLAYFPKDRVRIYLYDEFARDPEGVMRDAFGFLGLRQDIPLDLSQRHNEPRVPRFPSVDRYLLRPAGAMLRRVLPVDVRSALNRLRYRQRDTLRMSSDDRRFLIEFYEEDVRRLESIIGRDLSPWLV